MLHGFRLVQESGINALCSAFRTVSIHIERRAPGYFPLRQFSSRVQQHEDHLDIRGLIKESLIKKRSLFLSDHNLLNDQLVFMDHVIYANRHLYQLEHRDGFGLTNLERMKSGMRPIALDGKELVVIHHLEQTHSGTWIVLPNSFHCKHDMILHSQVTTGDPVRRTEFKLESRAFWKEEARLREASIAALMKPKF